MESKRISFASAIKEQQLRIREEKIAKKKKREKKILPLSQVHSFMLQIVQQIEKRCANVLQQIKTVIHSETPSDVINEMSLWADEHQLNLVHYAIVYRRPEVLNYLLSEREVYSAHRQPLDSPYAHLAAYLGRTDCLKIILSKRPKDFFKSKNVNENINLPIHIVKGFKLHRPVEKCTSVMNVINSFFKSLEYVDNTLSGMPDDVELITAYLESNIQNKLPPPPKSWNKKKLVSQISATVKPETRKDLVIDNSLGHENCADKTPLTLAAEKGHTGTVIAILEAVYGKHRHTSSCFQNHFYYATIAKSPVAIERVLEKSKLLNRDFYNALDESLRELMPECLIALLNKNVLFKDKLIDGENLFHRLYSLHKYADEVECEKLPMMTQALVYLHVNVNDSRKPCTFPLYSLITTAFTMQSLSRARHLFECLRILLAASANPYYNENRVPNSDKKSPIGNLSNRCGYKSIFHCILETAEIYEGTALSQHIARICLIVFLNTCKYNDKQLLNYRHLSVYLEKACYVGLNELIIKKMLQYGVNPSIAVNEKYPLNLYFDGLFSYFWKIGPKENYDFYKQEMEILMIVCRSMEPVSLRKAVRIILKQYIRNIPRSVVGITQYFFFLADNLMKERTAMGENFGIF